MSTQRVALGFWGYWSYLASSGSLTVADTEAFISKTSSGYVEPSLVGGTGNIDYTYAASPANNSTSGDTHYRVGGAGNYRSSYLNNCNQGSKASASLITLLQDGFEIHCNEEDSRAYTAGAAIQFVIGGVTYNAQWTSTGLELRHSTDSYASNLLTIVTNANATANWRSFKVRATFTGSSPNKVVTVKLQGNQSSNSVLAYYQSGATINGTLTDLKFARSSGIGAGVFDNISIYSFSGAEASTIATNWATDNDVNDTLPFIRYIPQLDKTNFGGTGWVGSDTDAHTDITDGSITTYSTTDDSNPIGFESPVTFAQAAQRTFSWTPGTLTALSALGLVRVLSQSNFAVANTAPETINHKYSDGTETVTKNVQLNNVPTGETVVSNLFSNDGTFTADSGTLTVTASDYLRSTVNRQ